MKVGECFDSAAYMSGVHKGLATRMKECPPLVVYVHYYGHLLNLALQASMTSIESSRNALRTVQKRYRFLEATPKRHRTFQDLEVLVLKGRIYYSAYVSASRDANYAAYLVINHNLSI